MPEGGHYSLLAKTIYIQHIYGATTIKRWHVIVWKVMKTVEAACLRGRIVKDWYVVKCSLVPRPHVVYFSHVEGKNSLVNGLFHFRSVLFKNWWRHVFKNVLCDVTQVMTLWNSAKETAHSRDHPSRTFRTLRNEDSQNLRLLSTSEVLRRSYRHLKLRNFTMPVGKLRSTYHAFMEVLCWSVLWFCQT